ncbi:PemI [Clostridium botulinum]|uniref:PemI n=2 Tax=Clostridium botulinum TaxID=1491 RepID=B2TSB6_CLOBB|nr:AbrB/MazE/SpoVT family DNA-binding domain-containing protein [Clostridium botulinum]ACD14157.1 putative PemI [Clostridium botulinum B str. Eklund 17B (NRP)]AIW54516.1 hypothetical protein [Clostridium botulinum]AIW54570.1 putative PemI [Clostridium botulinum]AIW54631.1 putative toxin-antitoxin system antitoxin PemI [Clostridium botulinum]AIW54685.1 putative PemI [Clostridium botulinum]
MKGKVTFNISGSGSKSARLTIPAALIELMKITEDNREVEITYEDGKLVVEKVSEYVEGK